MEIIHEIFIRISSLVFHSAPMSIHKTLIFSSFFALIQFPNFNKRACWSINDQNRTELLSLAGFELQVWRGREENDLCKSEKRKTIKREWKKRSETKEKRGKKIVARCYVIDSLVGDDIYKPSVVSQLQLNHELDDETYMMGTSCRSDAKWPASWEVESN